jgi:ribonuclease P/MRP protein subunit RPP1
VRHFVDLNVNDPGDPQILTEMLELASKLGFHGIAISSKRPVTQVLRDEARTLGIDLASRVDLRPRNTNELSKALRRIRKKFEIVAVHCENKAVSRQAAKDHRVDILTFPLLKTGRSRVSLDRQGASLAAGSNCAYEITLNHLLESEASDRPQVLINMRRNIWNATQEGVPVVVSSGAGMPLRMREPRAIASITSLLGISEEKGLDAVSETPRKILERNWRKLDPGFVSPGIREVL